MGAAGALDLSSMQNTDVEVEVGEQELPGSGEIIPKSLKRAGEGENRFHRRGSENETRAETQ